MTWLCFIGWCKTSVLRHSLTEFKLITPTPTIAASISSKTSSKSASRRATWLSLWSLSLSKHPVSPQIGIFSEKTGNMPQNRELFCAASLLLLTVALCTALFWESIIVSPSVLGGDRRRPPTAFNQSPYRVPHLHPHPHPHPSPETHPCFIGNQHNASSYAQQSHKSGWTSPTSHT